MTMDLRPRRAAQLFQSPSWRAAPGSSSLRGWRTGASAAHRWRKRSLSPCSLPEEGKVGLLATPEPRFCNLTNTVHGGWIMTMLDTVMALAAQTTLSPGETCPSHETTAKFVRPIFVDSGVMRVIGHVVSRGRTVITLEGRIEDAQGRLHAHGTSTCLVVSRKP